MTLKSIFVRILLLTSEVYTNRNSAGENRDGFTGEGSVWPKQFRSLLCVLTTCQWCILLSPCNIRTDRDTSTEYKRCLACDNAYSLPARRKSGTRVACTPVERSTANLQNKKHTHASSIGFALFSANWTAKWRDRCDTIRVWKTSRWHCRFAREIGLCIGSFRSKAGNQRLVDWMIEQWFQIDEFDWVSHEASVKTDQKRLSQLWVMHVCWWRSHLPAFWPTLSYFRIKSKSGTANTGKRMKKVACIWIVIMHATKRDSLNEKGSQRGLIYALEPHPQLNCAHGNMGQVANVKKGERWLLILGANVHFQDRTRNKNDTRRPRNKVLKDTRRIDLAWHF